MVFCMCPDTPPEKVSAKGGKGVGQNLMMGYANNPNQFALGLKDAPCAEPGCCCISTLGAPCGFTACWARKKVLDTYHGGIPAYKCFQGYIPSCCCMDTSNLCAGSEIGLCMEGCCCPVFSLSIARIHLMHTRNLRPDPCDYQIIACSNCLQLASCILDIIAIFVEQARSAADILECIADIFTLSVAGCMGAQIHHEVKKGSDVVVVTGQPIGAPPKGDEMER